MNKDYVLSGYCLDEKGFWNGHFITVLCDKRISNGIINMQKKITKLDKDFLSRIKEVYYA